ncbi:hypothetical protein Esi_0039_0114 [Ectocarpus siliculosus]|uniref:Uncharacterized protein n=1 Tax=Ectocarpus siliculosus TaxID=2880 RepID=D7G005_ECTSI|nr:hypothetical protein Esi_0039_0114 [Ectocarpus siliculosus]|eukprot:CBJ48630.1 hypothetical protein Esi_0039_0114 [Ectocarpus siliculosus]
MFCSQGDLAEDRDMSSEAPKNDASRTSSFLVARSVFEEGQGQPQVSSGVGGGSNLPAGKSAGREHDNKRPLARQELPPAEGNDAVPKSELLAMTEMAAKTESAVQAAARALQKPSAAGSQAPVLNIAPLLDNAEGRGGGGGWGNPPVQRPRGSPRQSRRNLWR